MSIIIILLFTGCTINENNTLDIKSKTNEELRYFEKEIFVIVNRYAKGEYLKEEKINWNEIKEEVNRLNSSLDTLIMDLSEVGISNEDILVMRNELNNVIISAGNEDKNKLLENISNLYLLFPNYLEKFLENKNKIEIVKLKSLILKSYIQADLLLWKEAKETVTSTEIQYKLMMDNVDYMKEYSYNLNKIYILLEELKNAIELEELELTKVKYINLIEEI